MSTDIPESQYTQVRRARARRKAGWFALCLALLALARDLVASHHALTPLRLGLLLVATVLGGAAVYGLVLLVERVTRHWFVAERSR